MYVIVDLEWVENYQKKCSFTQIALTRVDDEWNPVDDYFSFIRPSNSSFHQWGHVGYTGGTASDFLNAPNAYSVMEEVEQWLQPEDILLWWNNDGFPRLYKFNPNIRRETVVIDAYVRWFLASEPGHHGNAYRMAKARGIVPPGDIHESWSDVETIRLLLQNIELPQRMLSEPCPVLTIAGQLSEKSAILNLPYLVDIGVKTVHKNGCELLLDHVEVKGYKTLRSPLISGCAPCRCVEAECRKEYRVINQERIENTKLNFFFTPKSDVFHRRGCKHILGAKKILGSRDYIFHDTDKRPCKICNPTPEDAVVYQSLPKTAKKEKEKPCPEGLTMAEIRAIKRQRQAKAERDSYERSGALTREKKADLYTLTQPRFAFWASAGYKNFHLRNCRNLSGLTNLQGFSQYDEAIAKGYRPCKCCKPSKKHDANISLPIYSEERYGESRHVLTKNCDNNGYTYTDSGTTFTMETPVGIWKIFMNRKPYRLEHINLVSTPDNRTKFHEQPRIFHSLQDTFSYIKRHDLNLMAKSSKGTA